MTWQVVEKEDFGTDWHQVRYNAYALKRFDDHDEALEAASKYLTEVNCDNALTKAEKRQGFEAFMMTDKGCFLGILDGQDWYLTDKKGNAVVNKSYFELEGKTEVAVRQLPGS